jgi:Undecaprenyl-phosphate glucose phosphotransferase
MILRLKLYSLLLKVSTYLLPILASMIGIRAWIVLCHMLDRPTLYVPQLSELLVGTGVWALLSERYDVARFDELFRERTGARNAWKASVTTSFVLLMVLYFSRNQQFPRLLLVCDVLALLSLTILLHAMFRVLCRNRAHLGKPIRLLIIGADQFAANAAQRLQRLSFAPCEIAGYVRLPGQEVGVAEQTVCDLERLETLNSRDKIDEAVIAIAPHHFYQLPAIIESLKRACLPARAIVDLGERVVVKEKLFQLGNMQMLDLTATPAESLDYALVKRAFDVCFSSVVLVATSPLLALIAILVKTTSAGPVLFAQERVGLNGNTFRMYKFRTMRVSASSESDTRWTTPRDPRVTLLGAILRKTSFDELPQFINVLRGDMSVVGPRPERPHFVHKFLDEVASYNNRHALKVGITGWAQVNGWRGDTSIEKRVEYDLYYLQNWSFSLDIRIIVMTMLAGLIARNAY